MSVRVSSTAWILPSGMPCWVELVTTDDIAAQVFYGGLFGWRYRAQRDPATRTGSYLIASLNGADVGGLYRAEPGWPSMWMLNLAVRSTTNAAGWVGHLGGKVVLGPLRIYNRGSILHVIEPSGAPVVLWQPPQDWDFISGVPNTLSGADLNTHDPVAADNFFCRLFNYAQVRIDDGRGIDYVEWRLDGEPVLHRYVMGPEYTPETPAHWMIYFEIDPARGVDATAEHALTLGGRVLVNPYDSPWGRIAILSDPTGALFSVIDHSLATQDWGQAEVDDPYDD